MTPLKKLGVAYGGVLGNPDYRTYLAQHFDLLDSGDEDSAYVADFKAQAPNCAAICYEDLWASREDMPGWAEINTHEDWFYHDVNGNRFKRSQWYWYAMNPASGWREYYAQRCLSMMTNYPAWDGIFADDASPQFYAGDDAWVDINNNPLPQSQIPQWIRDNYHADMRGQIQRTKAVLGSHLLILNMNYASDFMDYADGLMIEGGMHPDWWRGDEWYETWYPPLSLSRFQELENYSAQGKIVVTLDGIKTSNPPTTQEQQWTQDILTYTLCLTYIGSKGPQVYYGFNKFWNPAEPYHPEMDVDYGTPTSPRYDIVAPYFIGRDYTKARFLANIGPTAQSTTINSVTYTVQPHSGLIIPLSTQTDFTFSVPYTTGSINLGMLKL